MIFRSAHPALALFLAFVASSAFARNTQDDSNNSSAGAGAESARQAQDPGPQGQEPDAPKQEQETKPEPEKVTRVRLIAPSGNYTDHPQALSLDVASLLLGDAGRQKSFFRLCEYIDELAGDNKVDQVVLDLSDAVISMNAAQMDEFARHMGRLRAAGKKTFAWLENAGNVHLSMAATCDEVLLADFGSVDMPSVAMQSIFYRDAMDLVGIKASVVRAGDFKGAVEPYTNSAMSEHLREHYLRMLRTINDAQVARIASGRRLPTAIVRDLQKQRFFTPREALEKGLVDRLAPFGQMRPSIEARIGTKVDWTTPKTAARRSVSFLELMGRMMSGGASSPAPSGLRDASLVVFHLSGTIVDGKKASAGEIVSGPVVEAIRELADDDQVRGVVVRINSPGGSATASEAIRRALKELAGRKPTIVSMGDVAASGGYWVSCIGAPVYAERGTVTGSIGAFSLKLSFGTLMRRVGFHLESITLDESAAAFAMDRPWSTSDETALSKMIGEVYDRFLELVCETRGMGLDNARNLAGGRVWSGAQAKTLGLVDDIGGVDDCLQRLARETKLEKYKVVHRPQASSGLDLLELFGSDDSNEIYDALPLDALRALRARGLATDTTLLLIRDAIQHRQGPPRIWLLQPAELHIR